MRDPNLDQLIAAADALRPLLSELVFVGGCVTGLLITDEAAGEPRGTIDVDVIQAYVRLFFGAAHTQGTHWVEIRNAKVEIHDPTLESLDAGEEAAITLAIEVHADLLLMDDEEGVAVARGKGLEATGTLGILVRAARRHLLVLREAVDCLKQTNFRFRQDILDPYLAPQSDNN